MALRNRQEELSAAWRALAGDHSNEGWRTIPVNVAGACHLFAGRHFPGNEEALLIGFKFARIPPDNQLPKGNGFVVSKVEVGNEGAGYNWVALRRQPVGNLELFLMMSDDIALMLEKQPVANDDQLLQLFIARISAWQEFMCRSGENILSPEAEVGLIGELAFLYELLTKGLPPEAVINSWLGPLGGIQDFRLGTGAIEVKTSVSAQGFPAKIGTLDQLDDSLIEPIFLAAFRLEINPLGKSLPILIEEIRKILNAKPIELACFDNLLIQAGYIDQLAKHYTRNFLRTGFRLLLVSDNFPRLTRANVAIEIRRARYELDLDLISLDDINLIEALAKLGVY